MKFYEWAIGTPKPGLNSIDCESLVRIHIVIPGLQLQISLNNMYVFDLTAPLSASHCANVLVSSSLIHIKYLFDIRTVIANK